MTDFVTTTSTSNKGYLEPAEGASSHGDVNLIEALDWILHSSEGHNISFEPDDTLTKRRLDLLMWIMNLERRLSPYPTQDTA